MKAILITDMPDNCNDCTFRTGDNRGNYWCHALLPRLKLGTIDGTIPRHVKCPLKPLPQKNKYDVEKYATVDYENNVTLGHFLNKGYNACIDEILGEEK